MKHLSIFFVLAVLAAGCSGNPYAAATGLPAKNDVGHASTIQHVVIIEMENRSFDSYFGTYPGVNGIPSNPTCSPDPKSTPVQCIRPFHDTSLSNYGGPHDIVDMVRDIDGGKLDGFIVSSEKHSLDPKPDEVMGYHTCAEIPVYCGYAQQGTLADNHFAASNSYSVMAHLYLVSAWSAVCSVHGDPMSCKSSGFIDPFNPDYAWTDITWLLHAHGISWGYFLYGNGHGSTPPEEDQGDGEAPGPDDLTQVSAWNPLPGFDDVRLDGENQNIQVGANFIAAAGSGTLPAVSWVVPPFKSSDHPRNSIAQGQAWVQKQVNAALNGPDASSTLILLTWDEWGGFYDHVVPPVVDFGGYGFRTPLILIGPMVKQNYIDHQLLTSDAYLKLIEDVFLGSERIDVNDGRPDPRPDVREIAPGLGDLRNDLIGN